MFVLACLLFVKSSQIWGTQANVALNKPATQSSTYSSYAASLAVDGNSDLNFYHGSCSHTACSDKSPHWVVDLGTSYNIKSVSIANSFDANDRLYNFKIEVFVVNPNTPGAFGLTCYTQGSSPVAPGQTHLFTCGSVLTGRYVKISKVALPGRYNCDALLLCEVMVATASIASCSPGFVKIGGSCYHLSRFEAEDWFQAREACMAMGADLAVVDTLAEATALKAYMNSVSTTLGPFYFIGGHSLAEGANKFVWIDPSAYSFASFSDWGTFPSQPNNVNADCVTMWKLHGFKWNDLSCLTNQHFVCETKMVYSSV